MFDRWLGKLNGLKEKTAAGEFDMYIVMAARCGWTPDQVNELDPAFVEEILEFWQAENEHGRLEHERMKRQRK